MGAQTQAAYRQRIDAALTQGHFQREGGVPATRRYKLEWHGQFDYHRDSLRQLPEDWSGHIIPFSEGLKLIEPGAVHCLCISEKGYPGAELLDVINIQF